MAIFDKLFGNSATKERLASAILNGTLPHALLIYGERGSGKHTLAREIAAALICQSSKAGSVPCGECSVCKRVREDNHTDVKTLRKQAGKATIGVEEVRLFRDDMFLSPSEADKKVYIIEDAECLTVQSQNALLKVLEEPPSTTYIILLTSSSDKILSTIKSRTQYIAMELHSQKDTVRYLKLSDRLPLGLGEEKYEAAARLSRGLIGRAIEELSPERLEAEERARDCVLSFLRALPQRTPFSELYRVLNSFPQKRDEFRGILELLLDALRDLIAARASECSDTLFFKTREEAEETVPSVSLKRLTDVSGIILSAIEDTDKNVITSALITDLALKIKQN